MPTVELSAGRMHYAEQGEGPAVVLLHGLFMNHTVWDDVIDLLPEGFRYLRPDLPLGAHPLPLEPGTDLSLRGLNALIAEFLAALDLRDVVLVHSDWGGGLFLTAYGLDERVGRLIILPCEAFDNFPPGLPGKMTALATYTPGGISVALWQLRIGWLRRTPLMLGWMARRPLSADLVRGWTEPGLRDKRIRRDLLAYTKSRFDKAELIANTEALQHFSGDSLVLWSSAGKVMPRDHGPRLATLLPSSRLVEIDDAYVLSMLDQPEAVADAMSAFLTEARAERGN
ncbi:alpha/beta hydrolase [Nocardia puris]|uniref:Pimeloyl-ACP methyl ester carboxylesterase n=1 Tax=Nocardia puris TaxID=208602 RepID=A0A366D0K4_9NOCA|nr:alpha/beta hydrolase [Nocardia puris]MBF6211635.1 alpha/beta hydrolase [Nocardia puris]MBF6365638.1 alpha/beta hydrolase [Nocardia puris]MBF6460719.1 alpha/beta hydrolase [Nocardia puris]RBO83039.1 pimeloyl-ACP methyl ester carboxylesterase [Nocardia puris]